MSDRTVTEQPPDGTGQQEVTIETLPTSPAQYANHVALVATQNELFLDFFFVAPPPGPGYSADHVARIAIPTTAWRGVYEALEQQIATYERQWGVKLPNMRDKITQGTQ